MYNTILRTIEDVITFFKELNPVLGIGFHPDTAPQDYIDRETGEPTFDEETAANMEARLDEAYEICMKENKDIYTLSMFHVGGLETFYSKWTKGERTDVSAFEHHLMKAYSYADKEASKQLETAFPEYFEDPRL